MSKVILKGARLSTNPATATVKHEQGINGMVNATQNGKLFYVTECIIMDGMKPIAKSGVVWANDNDRFALSAEEFNTMFGGSTTEGKLVTFNDVPAYEVENSKGEMKSYTHVKLLVLEGEDEHKVIGDWLARNGNVVAPPKKTEGATPTLSIETSEAPAAEGVVEDDAPELEETPAPVAATKAAATKAGK